MNPKFFPMHSLKTRLTVSILVIFLTSMWALTFFASWMLREDLQRLLGEQQFETVSMVADGVNDELSNRVLALESVAAVITPAMFANPAALQTLLESRTVFLRLFNGGVFTTDNHGTATTSVPRTVPRIGTNYMDRDHIAAALKNDESTLSKPFVGQRLQSPLFSIAAPIHNAQGQVMGALVGVTNLSLPNFLNHSINHPFGETGRFLLAAPQYGVFVSATDGALVLKALPAPGVNRMYDRYAVGVEGYGITVNSHGVEEFSAGHQVPVAGWYVAATISAAETFAPIRAMQKHMLFAALILTLLAGGLTWWLLRRQLTPLLVTAKALSSMANSKEFPSALLNARHDEVGHLIAGFNQLLGSLHERDAALSESEARFRTLIEWTPEPVAVHRGGKLLYANPAALHMFGATSQQDLVGKPMLEFVHPDYRQSVVERMQRSYDQSLPPHMVEEKFLKLDGAVIDVEVTGIVINYDGQSATQVAMHDITARKLAEDQLRTLSRIVEQAPISIFITDLDGNIKYANPWNTKITGYSAEEIRGQNPRLFKTDQTAPEVYRDLWQTLRAGGVWRGEFGNRKKNGDVFVEQAVIASVLDDAGRTTHYVALKEDVTERKRTEQALQASLQEKVALLNEVHHRVKNNLQVITSLLRLEAGRSSQPDTKSVLTDMQGRIRSMALLHESLYRSGIFASVDLGSYLKQLASQAFRAQSSGAVRLELELASVPVSMDQATPCGLLLNELISNCLKHGFPDGRSGEVRVELQVLPTLESDTTQVRLRVSDTGVGLPEDIEVRRSHSLGLHLVDDLARQLGATLEIGAGRGAQFVVTFEVQTITAVAKVL
jgi:PAS domain S-box-containing protein